MYAIQFRGETLFINKGTYANGGRISLSLNDPEGFPYMTATCNLPNEPTLNKNQTFIKNWSENEGILQALVHNNIVKDLHIAVPTGYVRADLVEVLI